MITKRITQDLSIIVAPPLKFTVYTNHYYMYVDIEILEKGSKNNYKFLKSRKHDITPRVFRRPIITIEQVVQEELQKLKE